MTTHDDETRDALLDEAGAYAREENPSEEEVRQAVERVSERLRRRLAPVGSATLADASARHRILQPRLLKWFVPVAAAAMILIVISLWPDEARNGIAWADVVRQISNVKTVVWTDIGEGPKPSGGRIVEKVKFYFKDPGKVRRETHATPTTRPVAQVSTTQHVGVDLRIDIWHLGRGQTTHMVLYPELKRASRVTQIPGYGMDSAAENWSRLKAVTADQTRKIGEREIDGIQAVCFEAPLEAIFGPVPPEISKKKGRVWVATETAVPVRIEAQIKDSNGLVRKITRGNIQWNVRLSDDLFAFPDDGEWAIEDTREKFFSFTQTSLRRSVTVRVSPKSGSALLTEHDIEAIRFGKIVDDLTGEKPRQMLISAVMRKAGKKRIASFAGTHYGEKLIIDFNGELQNELDTRVDWQRLLSHLQIDVAALGKTFEQFEIEYLTSGK